MAKWILKAIVQKAISFLPYKERLNFFFQKHVTRGVDLTDRHLECKLDAARDHRVTDLRYYSYLDVLEEIEGQNYWERRKV